MVSLLNHPANSPPRQARQVPASNQMSRPGYNGLKMEKKGTVRLVVVGDVERDEVCGDRQR